MDRAKTIIVPWLKENVLLVGTLSGVIVGLILGFSLKRLSPSEEIQLLIAYPGEMYIRALQLMILPVVICSLFVGAGGLGAKSNGKIVLLTFGYFLATSLFNAVLGAILAASIQPGANWNSTASVVMRDMVEERNNTLLDNFMDLGRNILPNNMFTAFFEQTSTAFEIRNGNTVRTISTRKGTNTLGVITYTLIFGSVLSTMGDKGKPILDLVRVLESLVLKTLTGIIWTTPVGVASIICAKIVEVDNMWLIMGQLGLFILSVVLGILIYQLGFMQLLYFVIIRKNPFKFYLGVLPAAITGFSADSSAAALPVTLRCLDENVKLDRRISRFVVPIGVTVNMDGTALFVCISSIFIAQMNGIPLSFADYISICVISTAVSIAVAAASHASLMMLFIVLSTINAPTSDIGLLFAIDWFLDRVRTTNNVLGDCYAAAVVEHWTKSDLASVENEENVTTQEKKDHNNEGRKVPSQYELEVLEL